MKDKFRAVSPRDGEESDRVIDRGAAERLGLSGLTVPVRIEAGEEPPAVSIPIRKRVLGFARILERNRGCGRVIGPEGRENQGPVLVPIKRGHNEFGLKRADLFRNPGSVVFPSDKTDVARVEHQSAQ